jgi:ATP-binding cassette subfamily F protein 3
MIKKLDKIDRIEVDEDDNSVMNISFPLSKVPGKVVIEADPSLNDMEIKPF